MNFKQQVSIFDFCADLDDVTKAHSRIYLVCDSFSSSAKYNTGSSNYFRVHIRHIAGTIVSCEDRVTPGGYPRLLAHDLAVNRRHSRPLSFDLEHDGA